MHHQLYSFRNN